MITRPALHQYPINLRSYGHARTPGLHLSTILRHLVIRTGIEKWGNDSLDEIIDLHTLNPSLLLPGQLTRLILGYMWEEWCFRNVLKNSLSHFGEFFLDDIIGTPDAINPGELLLVHECKATFKSSKRGVPNVWVYQGAAYIMMVAKTMGYPLKDCRLVVHPFYVKGDYRGIDPQYIPQEIQMEPAEVIGIWNAILEEKEIMKKEEKEGIVA